MDVQHGYSFWDIAITIRYPK